MSNKSTVLLVEDDPDILELVEYNLRSAGFNIVTAKNGEEGLGKVKTCQPSVIILDLMLPGIDGLTVCKRIRQDPEIQKIPIIMLTAKSEESDIIVGLEVGADDYLSKPFSPKELIARLRALLRRDRDGAPVESKVIKSGPIEIDTERYIVRHHGNQIGLTLAEFKLLRTLILKPGRVFSRDQLLDAITGGETYLVDRNIDVHVRSIRKKLGDDADLILTVRGVGYKWKE